MTMKIQRTRPERMAKNVKINILVNTITTTMRLVGCTPNLDSNYTYWLTNIAVLIFIFVTVLEAIALIIADDAERRFECFSVLSLGGMGILKLTFLRLYKDRWMFLLKQINTIEQQQMENNDFSEEYDSDDENDSTFDIEQKYYFRSFGRISLLIFKMYGITVVIFVFAPILEYAFTNNYIDNHQGYPHILPIWQPFDPTNLLAHVGTVLIEAIAAIFNACVHATFDVSTIGFMIFCRGQLRMLRFYSENIAGSGKLCSISHKRDVRGLFRIKNCHRWHIFLMNFIKELGSLLKYILGVYYLVETFTLCTVVLRLNSEVLTPMECIRLLQCLCATLTQLFLFCYYGNNVVNESSVGMGKGPYGCAFWSLSPRVHRELIILAAGMSLPLKLKAWPFHTLDLASFTMILRAAYSYYAVLRH